MKSDDINYIKLGTHLMKIYLSQNESQSNIEKIIENGLLNIYIDILSRIEELPVIV
jgi:hypothetical protein